MAEYIERGAVIDAIMSEPTSLHYPDYYAAIVNAIPAADDVAAVDMRGVPYCPNCGARMDGGADDATD